MIPALYELKVDVLIIYTEKRQLEGETLKGKSGCQCEVGFHLFSFSISVFVCTDTNPHHQVTIRKKH